MDRMSKLREGYEQLGRFSLGKKGSRDRTCWYGLPKKGSFGSLFYWFVL